MDAYPERDFSGKIRMVRLNPTIQQNVVTYNVVIDVSNEKGLLKPGMTAQVNIIVAQKADVLRVPTAALRFRPKESDANEAGSRREPGAALADGAVPAPAAAGMAAPAGERSRRPASRVYKLGAKGEPIPVEVKTGITSNQYTEVASGDIKPGDLLVTRETAEKSKTGFGFGPPGPR